jgi:flagellar assembly protein FliH
MLRNLSQPTTPFLFDKAFDGGAGEAQAELDAVAEAKAEAAYAQGERDGFAKGYAQAQQEIEAATRTTLHQVSSAMHSALVELDDVRRTLIAQSALVAAQIGNSLAGQLIDRFPLEHITSLTQALLPALIEENRIVVRVHDTLIDAVKARLDAQAASLGFSGRLIFLAEPTMPPGDARLEWARGGTEINMLNAQEQIRQQVENFAQSILAGGEESA